jgi:hypothetical protein
LLVALAICHCQNRNYDSSCYARGRACALSDLVPLLQMAAHRASRSRPSPPINRAMLALACAVAAAAVAAGGGVRTHALHDDDHDGDFRVSSEKGTAPVVKRTLLSSLSPTLLVGSVRPDVWIPQFKVPGQDAPTTGRRVHIVAPINASVCDADLASVSFRDICCPSWVPCASVCPHRRSVAYAQRLHMCMCAHSKGIVMISWRFAISFLIA